jgi:hypothetical protein
MTCPNKSNPDWIALVDAVGEKAAIEAYVKNNYDIPKLNGYVNPINEGLTGTKFNQVSTQTKLNEAPKVAQEIINKLNTQMPDVQVSLDGLIKDGKWIKIPPGQDGMHNRNAFVGAVAWANDSMLETPPHEYAHEYIEMFKNHPLVRKAIMAYGSEGLAIKMGQDFVNRTLSKNQLPLIERIWDVIRNFFGSKDVADIISDNFYKGEMMSGQISEGNNIISYNTKKQPLKRIKGAFDSKGKFDENSVVLKTIDTDRAVDYIMQTMAGYNVFGNLKSEFDFDVGQIVDKVEGEVNPDRAALVFKYIMQAVQATDRDANGKYANRAGISIQQIRELQKRLFDQEHVKELLEIIQGNKPQPAINNLTKISKDYWLLVRAMQKLNYLEKVKNGVIADNNKIISKVTLAEEITKNIESLNQKRADLLDKKFKNPYIRKFVKWSNKQITDYFITPYLTAKYLAGEDSVFMDMFYRGLDNADTNKLRILQQFDKDLALKQEVKNRLGKYSAFSDSNLDISKYKGLELDLVVNDNQTKVKLTDGEILSLYLTAQQKGDQSIFPDSDSPRLTLIKHGFQLDKIEGRPGMAKTRYNFSEGTLQAIEKHVESNPDLMQVVKNVNKSLDNLFVPLSETFKQQNGFYLPKYENYFPVTTYLGAYDMKVQRNNIESFKSIRDRVGSGKPFYISDVNKVLAYHSQNASSYSAYAIPIENNRKIIKMLKDEYDGGGKEYETINKLLDQAESKLVQLNDPTFLSTSEGETRLANTLNKGMSNFAVAVLSWNIPVMMKQPISYMAAREMINAKYLAKAGWGAGGIAGISPKQIWDSISVPGVKGGKTILPVEWQMDEKNPAYQEIIKWSPKLTARFDGAVSKEMGEAMFEKKFGKDEITLPGLKNKNGDNYKVSRARLMEGIKIFDAATVMSIWSAVQEEAKEMHPNLKEGSNEFMEHVAQRTENIVNATQPTFDLMNRTNLSSMKNPFARTFSMFGSARSKLGALMIDGFYDAMMNPTKENKIKLWKRTFNLAVLNGLAISMANALAMGFDFDDEDKDGRVVDDIGNWTKYQLINNAFGNFYFGGEVSRFITSRIDDAPWRSEIDNPLEQVLNDGLEATTKIVRIGKTDKRTGEWNYTIDNGLWQMVDVGTKMMGMPNKLVKWPEKSYEYFIGDEE